MSRSALVLCLLAAVCGAAHPSRLRGLTPDFVNDRIIGGEPVEISQYPWQVSLEVMWYGMHFCGGSIIGSSWVLTAAHCTKIYNPQWLYVRAGSSYHGSGGYVYNVTRIIEHEDYDDVTMDSDIALLEISEPIAFGSKVQAVMLGSSEIVGGTKVNVSGWGQTSVGEDRPEKLQAITTSVVDRDTCKKVYGPRYSITERMICAGEMESIKGVWKGDSGGALVAGNTQYGVVSWAFEIPLPGVPEVYSNVSAVRSWITEKTGV